MRMKQVVISKIAGARLSTVSSNMILSDDASPFSDVADRTAAEELRGAVILAARADLPPPAEDEIYLADLEGCTVEDDVLIGNAAMVLHRSVIHRGAIVAVGGTRCT